MAFLSDILAELIVDMLIVFFEQKSGKIVVSADDSKRGPLIAREGNVHFDNITVGFLVGLTGFAGDRGPAVFEGAQNVLAADVLALLPVALSVLFLTINTAVPDIITSGTLLKLDLRRASLALFDNTLIVVLFFWHCSSQIKILL